MTVSGTAQDIRLRVTDQGPGIAAEQVSRLFEPFSRLDEQQGVAGLGIGLAIAKGIAEAHGGRIGAESRLGHGSTFSVVLPRHAKTDEKPA